MLLATGGVIGAAAVYAGVRARQEPAPTTSDQEAEIIEYEKAEDEDEDKKSRTWRESAGRTSGRDGYVFGDVTRGVVGRFFGSSEEDKAIEAAGDEQYSRVQKLVSEAVKVYRARGYSGSINMSHSVAYFTETCSVKVDAPDTMPWLGDDANGELSAMAEEGKAGRIFATLLSRLERRATGWQAMNTMEGLDPSLTSAAQIGFRVPVVQLGWGVSVSLTVTTSSLLRWAAHVAAQEEELEKEARVEGVAAALSSSAMDKALKIARAADEQEAREVD